MIRLRNGSEELEPTIKATMVSLDLLLDRHPTAFYDFAMMARNPNYKPWGGNGKILADMGLVRDGEIRASVRNVVLSAVEGEGTWMVLRDPRAAA